MNGLVLKAEIDHSIKGKLTSVFSQACCPTQCAYLPVIDFLEDVFEPTIISLQNCVLGAQVERPFFLQRILETAVCKPSDGLAEKVKTLIEKLATYFFHYAAKTESKNVESKEVTILLLYSDSSDLRHLHFFKIL